MRRQAVIGIILIVIGVAGLLFLGRASWGGEPGARTVDIVATDSSCQPAEVSIKTGESVNLRLVNQGATPHGFVIPQQGIRLYAPPGQSVTSGVKTDQSGEYTFFCGVPRQRGDGTVGRIIVTP